MAFSAIVYTIPSLALFQLLVPITGLTVATVEVALVGYTLLILYRNIVAGLRGVPRDVLEAARGMGFTRRQTLWRVELPLALPAMIAGLRVAVVSTIALATVAALVIPQGLGYPIFTALRENFKTEIIVAGGLAVALALVADGLLVLGERALDAVGAGSEDGVIGFDLGVFGDALEFVVERRGLILEKTWEHLQLSAAAMAVALLVALPLGSWLGHLHRGSFVAVNLANIGRALPSLAVIAVGIAFLGVGFTNITLALVILAVPPILTNAYVGVDGVEADAVEAARGMGMTRWQIVRRIEVPLALPLIFAGIRTAVVFVVATATIAAVAGGGGLGDIIVNQSAYGLDGVVGAAICVSAARSRRRRGARPPATLAHSGGTTERRPCVGARCHHWGDPAVGSAAGPSTTHSLKGGRSDSQAQPAGREGRLHDRNGCRDHPRRSRRGTGRADGWLDADHHRDEGLPRAVRARAAVQAGARGRGLQRPVQGEHRLHRADRHRAPQRAGDDVPGVHRDMLSVTFKRKTLPRTALGTSALAKRLYERRGQTLLRQTPFQDRDAIAVLRTTANRYGLRTVGDLKKVPELTLAGFPQFETRWAAPIARLYGVRFEFEPLAGISAYTLLDRGQVEAAAIFTTDPQLINTKYVVLREPRNMFGFQHVAPVLDRDLVSQYGSRFTSTINAVSQLLTLRAQIAMNKAVAIDKRSAARVA